MKHADFTGGWRRGLRLAACGLAVASPAVAGVRSLTFEQVFASAGEPTFLHGHVVFTANGGAHQLEIWRDGDRRVKRVTDNAVTTFAFHKPGDAGYRMSVLDMKRRIHTQIDRTNLYRLGNFSDWFDLGHGLRHPKGQYTLAKGAPPRGLRAIAPCGWYDLTQAGRTTHVCWDAASHFPLIIASPDGQALWRVVALDRKPIRPSIFVINDKGYVRNDANRDIERD